MNGNNYLKQLAFGARANSPVPVCRLWNGFPSEARISRLSVTICRRQKKRGRVSPRTSLKVVFASCSGCFQSQNAWVRNAPDVLWQYFVMPPRQWDGSENVPFYDVTRFLNRARPPLTHRADWYGNRFGIHVSPLRTGMVRDMRWWGGATKAPLPSDRFSLSARACDGPPCTSPVSFLADISAD